MRSACDFASASSRSASPTGMAQRGVGFRGGRGHHAVGVLLGVTQHGVAGVQHILGVVEFAGDGVLDVVDEFEDVAPGYHAARRHRHAARLFDDGTQLVERFKYSVHSAHPSGLSQDELL